MSETVELEVGDLYANLHEQFEEQIGEQFSARARQNYEEFLHNFNQQIERQTEQAEGMQPEDIEPDELEEQEA